MIDKELFLRDTMPNIFRSRDIETLLMNSFHTLKKHLPLDRIDFSYYMHDNHSINVCCSVENGNIARNKFIRLPDDMKPGSYPEEIYTLTECYDLFKDTPRLCPTENNSTIIMQCRHADVYKGHLSFKVQGEYVYHDFHKLLMKELVTPYNMALSHVLFRSKDFLNTNNLPEGSLRRNIIGSGGGLQKVVEQAEKVAAYSSAVLLTGETGTGKDVLANFIHASSERCNADLIKINCGAVPENLIEAEFFGYEKGAFTGADSLKKGCFELADNGTLFLDEVGELSLAAQTKLLRALQFGEVRRLGGTKSILVNTRIIAATNRDLAKAVLAGEFRKDLYWRLNVFPIDIPPIRERKEDIPLLIEYLIKTKCEKLGIRYIPQVSSSVMHRLVNYDWSGNIREMENAVEREIITFQGRELLFEGIESGSRSLITERCTPQEQSLLLDEAMKNHILKTLEQTKWRISGKNGAADMLGINASTLRHRMRKLGLL